MKTHQPIDLNTRLLLQQMWFAVALIAVTHQQWYVTAVGFVTSTYHFYHLCRPRE